jgi:hypothetical protein
LGNPEKHTLCLSAFVVLEIIIWHNVTILYFNQSIRQESHSYVLEEMRHLLISKLNNSGLRSMFDNSFALIMNFFVAMMRHITASLNLTYDTPK